MDATADEEGFVVAYPQGDIPAGSGYDWNVPGQPLLGGKPVPADAPDDVGFLRTLIVDLVRRYCLDAHRVFSTGLSGGGRLSSQLGCDAPDLVAAVAPVAGVRFPAPCHGSTTVPLLAFHGTADPIDPYAGHGQAYWTYSVPVAVRRWAVHDRCSATPTTASATGYTLTTYKGCADGSVVELYSLTGAGHQWPGHPLPASFSRLLGPGSRALDANAVMWKFFASQT